MNRKELFHQVQQLIAEQDLYAASAFVLSLDEAQAVAEAFENLVLDCYHEAKSLEQVLHFGSAGIHYCLTCALARDGEDTAAATALRYAAKRMATNVASFTWPGWKEPGISISPEQMRQGLVFARYSVRQLRALAPTPAQLAYTHWFLGAQLLAHRLCAEAQAVFETARAYNQAHGQDTDGRLMLDGYIGLAKLLAGRQEPGESEFTGAVTALQTHPGDDAQFYAAQLLTARAVLEPAADSREG